MKQLPALGVTYMRLPTVRCKLSSLSNYSIQPLIKNKFLLVLVCTVVCIVGV